jgi:hypothetical protein
MSGSRVGNADSVSQLPTTVAARIGNAMSFSNRLAGEGGMAKLLNLSRLLLGHLLNQLLDSSGRRRADLNELHATHDSADG